MDQIWYVLAIVVAVVFLAVIFTVGPLLNLYIQALLSGAQISAFEFIGMRLRKVDIRTIVLNRIRSVKAGLNIPVTNLETHYLAGGDVTRAVNAVLSAQNSNISMTWEEATRFDLDGIDPVAVVAQRQDPKSAALADPHLAHLMGVTGQAITDLVPLGDVLIDGNAYQAVARRGNIPAGSEVRIVSIRGNLMQVQNLTGPTPPSI